MTEDQLEPCPFCGGKAEFYEWQSNDTTIYAVHCVVNYECPLSIATNGAPDKEWASKVWNKRADPMRGKTFHEKMVIIRAMQDEAIEKFVEQETQT